MPWYEYKCGSCGKKFDLKSGMGDAPESHGCVYCDGIGERVYTSFGIGGKAQSHASGDNPDFDENRIFGCLFKDGKVVSSALGPKVRVDMNKLPDGMVAVNMNDIPPDSTEGIFVREYRTALQKERVARNGAENPSEN